MIEAGLAVSLVAFLLALAGALRLHDTLTRERMARLSADEEAKAQIALLRGRLDSVEQRMGRARRVTPAKRERALELLALGAAEPVVARELQMREAEVALLAALDPA